MKEAFSTDIALLEPFVSGLRNDLKHLGVKIDIARSPSFLTVSYVDEKVVLDDQERLSLLDQAYTRAHNNMLRRSRDVVEKLSKSFAKSKYTPEATIHSDKIDIELEFLPAKKPEVGDYYSFYPRALSSPKGRKMHILVWDRGQTPNVLVGLLTLSSAQYFHGGRDKKLCWVKQDTYEPIQPRKNDGLKALYNVSNCFALSSYQALYASKMIALLPFTDVVAEEVKKRYGAKPLAFTTSSAFRSYATPFQRTNAKYFEALDNRRHKINRAFYKKLPTQKTSRVKLFGVLSDQTISAACDIAYRGSKKWKPKDIVDLTASKQVRATKIAFAQSRLPQRLLEAAETVVYLGYAREDCLDALREYENKSSFEPPTISLRDVQDYWVTQWINNRERGGTFEYDVSL